MGRYIVVPVKRDPVEAEEQSAEVIRQNFAAWRADDADPMTVFLRSVGVLYSDVAETATRVGEELFRFYGRGVADLPPEDELPAVGRVLITAQDANGPYLIPEGLEIEGRGPLGESVGFRTLAEAIIPNGATTLEVDVEASEDGEDGNGVSGVADFSEYVDYLTAVSFVGATAGGREREADEPFLDRLVDEIGISSPKPILPEHFAVLARRLGAFRATAIDGLNSATGTTGNKATMTVAAVDEAGNPLPSLLRTSIATALQKMREAGWLVTVIDPTYALFNASFTAVAYPGEDPVAAQAACVAALTDFYSPARYGLREDTGQDREWLNSPTLYYLEAVERLQRVESIWRVSSFTHAIQGNTLGTADIVMPGYAPLPKPNSISGTVNPG